MSQFNTLGLFCPERSHLLTDEAGDDDGDNGEGCCDGRDVEDDNSDDDGDGDGDPCDYDDCPPATDSLLSFKVV